MRPSLHRWAAGGEGGSSSGQQVPKPYTTPPGYKAPTLTEQFRYAALHHPYSRYGYVAAVLVGLLGWAIASEEQKRLAPMKQQGGEQTQGGSGGK